MKTYRIEASEIVHYVVEVKVDDDADPADAMTEAVEILSDSELNKDYIEDFSGFQTDRFMIDNGNGFFEEIED